MEFDPIIGTHSLRVHDSSHGECRIWKVPERVHARGQTSGMREVIIINSSTVAECTVGVHRMGREEVLRAIRQAESEAEQTIADAESKASEIVSKARLTATEIIQAGRSDSEANAQTMISEARSAAESEAQKVSKEGDSNIGSIHDGGEGSRQYAVNAVLDAFRS